jgi:hypothetical protein
LAHRISNGDLLEYTVVCLTQNQYTFNVFHFDVTAIGGASLFDSDVGAALDALMAPVYKAILPTNCSYYGSRIQVIKPKRFDPTFIIGNRGAGTLAGDCLPTQVAGLVNLKTGIASKRTRGRFYLPATSEADSTAIAQPSAGYLTAVASICNDLFTFTGTTIGADSVTAAWVVYSRVGDLRSTVVSYNPRPNWATIRRRSQIKHADSAPF